MNRIRQESATVEDSAAATEMLYEWVAQVPNVELDTDDWTDLDESQMSGEQEDGDQDMMPAGGSSGLEESFMPFMPGQRRAALRQP